jgi:hypothetical protein
MFKKQSTLSKTIIAHRHVTWPNIIKQHGRKSSEHPKKITCFRCVLLLPPHNTSGTNNQNSASDASSSGGSSNLPTPPGVERVRLTVSVSTFQFPVSTFPVFSFFLPESRIAVFQCRAWVWALLACLSKVATSAPSF